MPDTTNGVPYQSLTDPPNGAALGEDIALWLQANLGGGSTGQVLEADQVAASKVGFHYPRARTSASGLPGSGETGALVVPTAGIVEGELHWWYDGAWVRAMRHVDSDQFALGEFGSPVTKATSQTISSTSTWTDVSSLSITTTLLSSRRYVAHAAIGVAISAGGTPSAFSRFLYGSTHIGMLFTYTDDRPLTTGQGVVLLGEASTRPFTGTGSSGTVKVQAQKTTACGLAVGGTIVDSDFLAYLWLEDVGPV